MARNAQTESVDSNDAKHDNEKKPKSRRPGNTAFRQQRLKAWQPILTPKTVLPLFFVVGVIFAPLGGLMLYASAQVEELVIDYSHCVDTGSGGAPTSSSLATVPTYQSNFKTGITPAQAPQWQQSTTTRQYYQGQAVPTCPPDSTCKTIPDAKVCTLQFQVPDTVGPPASSLLLYYRLTNFYQNHRRYVKSFDSGQLSGTAGDASYVNGSSCDPLTSTGNLPYYPCGVVANSIFNDTIYSPKFLQTSIPETYEMTNKGIAWASDADLYTDNTTYDVSTIAVPPYWQARWPDGKYSKSNPPPSLKQYEELQVWMRTAGLPAFSKLALRNDDQPMTAGRYSIDIDMNFPVTEYGGTKSIVISTTTVIGGKNPFLGIAYVVVAGICVLLGLAFTALQLIKPRKLGDHTHLSWNNEQPSTGLSTGVSHGGNDTT